MVVEWGKPGVDGGSPVTGYYLERRDKKSLRWIRVYKDPITDIKKTVYHLTEGNEYQYRVCAINKAGEGPFSEASDLYKAADPVGKFLSVISNEDDEERQMHLLLTHPLTYRSTR